MYRLDPLQGREKVYTLIVFVHIAGVLLFMLGHGASANVALALRRERDPERIRALLDLSVSSFSWAYLGLVILLIAGIVAGFMGNHWGRGWIWTAIVVLVVLGVAMYALGSAPMGRLREAVGLKPYRRTGQIPLGEVKSETEIAALLTNNQGIYLTVLGLGGILILLYLMVFKPF